MKTIQASTTSKASPEAVWELWDSTHWSRWDPEVEWARLAGPFQAGTRGELKPKHGPKVKFVVTAVDRHRSFSDRSYLPLARLDFSHIVEPSSDGTVTITHTATFSGPLAFLFARVIGKKMELGLSIAVQQLARLAEKAAK